MQELHTCVQGLPIELELEYKITRGEHSNLNIPVKILRTKLKLRKRNTSKKSQLT